MKILFAVRQKKNVDAFLETLRQLVERGHAVTLTVQDPGFRKRLGATLDDMGVQIVRGPTARVDRWMEVAPLLRTMSDCLHYLQPQLRGALKLRTRAVHTLRRELSLPETDEGLAAALSHIPAAQVDRLQAILTLAEAQLPTDPVYDEFLAQQAPDLVLVSPLVHFGCGQDDLVASARARGIPVGMLAFSWDNLSTKTRLHVAPDRMFVWNEWQRREAEALHGFPPERVVVVGAPRFDGFFGLQPVMTRDDFHRPLGLDPTHVTLLYVCSSAFVSDGELVFVRDWLARLRRDGNARLRDANVIVRPHPDIDLLEESAFERLTWPLLPKASAYTARPFDDPRAIVLHTGDQGQALFECIYHSAAVVGLNTSAELEAAIVGRPVFTVLAGREVASGQEGTVHFHYLLEDHGGCVRVGRTLDEHAAQLGAELDAPSDPSRLQEFAQSFLRPLGRDVRVASALAEAVERTFSRQEDSPPRAVTAVSVASIPALNVRRDEDTSSAPETELDPVVGEWLRGHVKVGDVVYDVGAGVGDCAVLAARSRGAVVVAFEAGFGDYDRLCENVLLNGCDGNVLCLPLAVADQEGLAELKYTRLRAGHKGHVRPGGRWKQKRHASSGDVAYRQPVVATTLDAALTRYGLPRPNHLRIAATVPAAVVAAGASVILRDPGLTTIVITAAKDVGAIGDLLPLEHWSVNGELPLPEDQRSVVLCRKTTAAAAAR